MRTMDLSGVWSFALDSEKEGVKKEYYRMQGFEDSIVLPGTVATAKKGIASEERAIGHLTDPYAFSGYTWYSRKVDLSGCRGREVFLVLERTRISHAWLNGKALGRKDSLCTAHRYRIPDITGESGILTVMVDNSSYVIGGGHMTSPDTQTNWNGIVGEIYLQMCEKKYPERVRIYADCDRMSVRVKLQLAGEGTAAVQVMAEEVMAEAVTSSFETRTYTIHAGDNEFSYLLGDKASLWSEYSPKLYRLRLTIEEDSYCYEFGMREFKAEGRYFTMNGRRIFLRGKHDGMIFPITAHAPMDVASWLEVFETAKKYGINHYRFHTCCPPEAAFAAADRVGIYLEPELPFWGTVTGKEEPGDREPAQQYLIQEGFRILDEYGNHPSFVMMSMGNELWGSKERLEEILNAYRTYDTRHLYTQGSNNFQFAPCILKNDDFFCGVRFSRKRLFRGSYAMCDAPQGHIQTEAPSFAKDYDRVIRPVELSEEQSADKEIEIQYGTGTKRVKMEESEELIAEIPVISHEIGQYAMTPDFTEIDKYTGVLKARNLEVFRERAKEKGLLSMADCFFRASGHFSAQCYKQEMEAALKSETLAGFQLLDLQDFSGQGTALVGILNAFLENKGVMTDKHWRQFCAPNVLMAALPKLIYRAGEKLCFEVKLAAFGGAAVKEPVVKARLYQGEELLSEELLDAVRRGADGNCQAGIFSLGNMELTLPEVRQPQKLSLLISIREMQIENQYNLWIYPEREEAEAIEGITIAATLEEACKALRAGKKVLYYPAEDEFTAQNSIEGTYCTDFWCYPMFRSISESMNKPVPVGTHGLYVNSAHPMFQYFPTESYSTPQWFDVVSHSRALILDTAAIEPVVWTIDNFERNHKLGNIFEAAVGSGKLLLCTMERKTADTSITAKWLEASILRYMEGDAFAPAQKLSEEQLLVLIGKEHAELLF